MKSNSYTSDNQIVFPNPVANILNISFNHNLSFPVSVEIFDLFGRLSIGSGTLHYKLENDIIQLDVDFLQEGLYFLKVTENGQTKCFPITKY